MQFDGGKLKRLVMYLLYGRWYTARTESGAITEIGGGI